MSTTPLQAWADSFTLLFRLAEPPTRLVPSPSRSRNSFPSRPSLVSSGWVMVRGISTVSPSAAASNRVLAWFTSKSTPTTWSLTSRVSGSISALLASAWSS